MKKLKKRALNLTILTLFFLALYFAPLLIKRVFPKKQKAALNLNPKAVKSLTFVFSKDKVQKARKENSRWYIIDKNKKLPADSQRIENLLQTLSSLKKDEIVSRKKDRHKELGIKEKKIVIGLENGKKIELYIGDQARIQKFYARIDNENEVFIANGLEIYPEDWRDLNLHFIDKIDKVKELKIIFKDKKILIEKTKDGWKIGSRKADTSKVDFYLSDFKSLRGKNILFASTLPLKNPEFIIKILEDKKAKELQIFPKGEKVFAWIKGSKYVYEIDKEIFKNLQKTEKDFLP